MAVCICNLFPPNRLPFQSKSMPNERQTSFFLFCCHVKLRSPLFMHTTGMDIASWMPVPWASQHDQIYLVTTVFWT